MSRLMICERCETDPRVACDEDEASGEWICENCAENLAEARWQRHQEDLMENGPGPTLLEQQIEARKLK